MGGGGNFIPPFWFSLNNSETGKSCNRGILQHSVKFIWGIFAKFGFPNLPQSPDIGQNPDGGISDFWISGRSFMKKNCHNSRTSNCIDIKLGLVTKINKINTATSKKIDDDVMSANCNMKIIPDHCDMQIILVYSSITLTSFRQGVILPPTSKRTPKKSTPIRVKRSEITLISIEKMTYLLRKYVR